MNKPFPAQVIGLRGKRLQSAYSCHCGGPTSVIDTRPVQDIGIRRRRICLTCGDRVTTYESAFQSSIGILERAETVARKGEAVLAAASALLDEIEALRELTKAHGLIAAAKYGNAGPR